MSLDDIRPPQNQSPRPDRDTRRGLSDNTGKAADQRVLYINIFVLKYGTNDKAHAAAIVLSMALLLAIIVLVFFGTAHGDAAWNEKAFSWLEHYRPDWNRAPLAGGLRADENARSMKELERPRRLGPISSQAEAALSGAFLFVAGVALGRSGTDRKQHDHSDDWN